MINRICHTPSTGLSLGTSCSLVNILQPWTPHIDVFFVWKPKKHLSNLPRVHQDTRELFKGHGHCFRQLFPGGFPSVGIPFDLTTTGRSPGQGPVRWLVEDTSRSLAARRSLRLVDTGMEHTSPMSMADTRWWNTMTPDEQ